MAGVVMPLIFLQMHLPLGCWRRRMNDKFLGQRDTCGLVTPHRQGVKSKGWMIDRDLKWNRDTHLLLITPAATICDSWWLESGWV